MTRKVFSIRRRIFALAVSLLAVAAVALAIFINDYAERAADRAFDRLLAASALTIAGAVQIEDDAVLVELPFASFAMFSGGDRLFYTVRGPDNALVTGYDDLAVDLAPAISAEPVFQDLPYRGELLRLATVGRLISTADATGWVTIRVAETQNEREILSNEILSNAIVPLVALTLLAVGLVWFGIGRTFAPLASLEQELRARSPDDLSPVTVPVPTEVSQLVAALNDFTERLRLAIERMSGLVTEAAHEVRTPLASLRAQAEVAMDEPDPDKLRVRVARIHQSAAQASQLVSQLLMDATISHRLDMRDARPTTVSGLIEDVRRRLDPSVVERVRVSIAEGLSDAEFYADRVVLREMLRNVVDNAILYSSGPVEIGASTQGDGKLRLSVSDRGPGIRDSEKDAVLERFKRGSAGEGKTGSGLGLAIVKRVVDSHGGTLRLLDRDGGGLTMEIGLPVRMERISPQHGLAALIAVAVMASASIFQPISAVAAETRYAAPAGEAGGETVLTIVGTTDTPLFSRFVEGFQRVRPEVTVVYRETETLPMYEEFLDGSLAPRPDLMISSSSDLQLKLANDGHALAYESPYLGALPRWAQWRGEVIGFTFEPAVIIYNPALIAEDELPRTHLRLAELLEHQPERFRGKVGTYDIATSGVGYLLAAQDQLISSNFWRLATAFGRTGVHLSGSSPEILDMVARGDLALGYNVLGSYALARQAAGVKIGIIVPDDYVLVLTRTMLIPRDTPHADLAKAFVDFALSPQGQSVAAGDAALGSVMPGSFGRFTAEAIGSRGRGAVQPLALGPSLLVSLDQQRRARFLETWREIVAPR
ncbi:extracellular solute-binding protein [Mesorhizobium sp. CAU 1732]|uniref:extracellular solute-binding protein n=1 Tax=Mesorhizobium sp. CAU 1732 TaxID=3140358 RepID=UPI003261AE80